MAGLSRPPAGHVECGETWLDTARGIDLPPERRRCGYVFQEYALFPHLSAWRNVAYAASAASARSSCSTASGSRTGRTRGRASSPAASASAWPSRARWPPRPRALLLDEPLSALDPRTRARAARELAAVLRELDVPVVVVTHDFAEAALLAGEVAVLDGGRLVQRGTRRVAWPRLRRRRSWPTSPARSCSPARRAPAT